MIQRLQFSIDISADTSKIWKVLWEDSSYREWAGVFFEGSYAVADSWEEGNKVHFLAPDKSGIYSLIETHVPNKTITFKHIGNVVQGKEQPVDEETKKWSGATESYTLTEGTDHNALTIDIDIMDEHVEFMSKTFSKALEKIKGLSEGVE